MTNATETTVVPVAPAIAGDSMVAKLLLALVGSGILAASAWIEVPMVPVPMTMQTWAVLVIGALYGSRLGAATVALYLAEGFAGLPVFSGGAGGPLHLAGPTAGYLFAFPVAAWLVGRAVERGFGSRLLPLTGIVFVAHLLILAIGASWLSVLVGVERAIALGVAPFVLATLLKTALAVASIRAATHLTDRRRV